MTCRLFLTAGNKHQGIPTLPSGAWQWMSMMFPAVFITWGPQERAAREFSPSNPWKIPLTPMKHPIRNPLHQKSPCLGKKKKKTCKLRRRFKSIQWSEKMSWNSIQHPIQHPIKSSHKSHSKSPYFLSDNSQDPNGCFHKWGYPNT